MTELLDVPHELLGGTIFDEDVGVYFNIYDVMWESILIYIVYFNKFLSKRKKFKNM